MRTIPGQLTDEKGELVLIHRAWPRGDGSLTVEGREGVSGRIRAGRIDAGGSAFLVPFCEDPSLPGLSPEPSSGELLVHRLKRRAVVRSDGQFRKFIAGGKAASVAHAHAAAAAGLAGSGIVVPGVIAADRHSVTLAAVPGVSLHDLGRSACARGKHQRTDTGDGPASLAGWARAWELWAHNWPRFVGAPAGSDSSAPGLLSGVKSHTAEDEASIVKRWTELAVSFGALEVPESRLRSASASITRALLDGGSPASLAHRDLHDKQILVDPDTATVGIIDCDTLSVAEPALDLANLSVHLEFRVAQGLLSARAAALGQHHIRAVAEELQVPENRFTAYARATAFRLACIYAFRPPYRETAHGWFTRVEG